MSTVYS